MNRIGARLIRGTLQAAELRDLQHKAAAAAKSLLSACTSRKQLCTYINVKYPCLVVLFDGSYCHAAPQSTNLNNAVRVIYLFRPYETSQLRAV